MAKHTTEFFVDLETQVWQALVDGDAGADVALLSDDFLGVYPSGLATRSDHAGQVNDGPTVTAYQLTSPLIRIISEDDVLLTYHSRFQRPGGQPTAWWVTSLWTRREGIWLNVFSQDTVVDVP